MFIKTLLFFASSQRKKKTSKYHINKKYTKSKGQQNSQK